MTQLLNCALYLLLLDMNKTAADSKVPVYMKYAETAQHNWLDPSSKLKPSDMSKPSLDVNPEDYPKTIDLRNIMDHTSNVHCTVDLEKPLFQPAPKIVVFEDYQPFTTVTKKLFFRNNDAVSLHVHCSALCSPNCSPSAQ